jgi:hypothetical protein
LSSWLALLNLIHPVVGVNVALFEPAQVNPLSNVAIVLNAFAFGMDMKVIALATKTILATVANNVLRVLL